MVTDWLITEITTNKIHTPVYSIYIDADLLSANNVCKCGAAFKHVIDRHQLLQSLERNSIESTGERNIQVRGL